MTLSDLIKRLKELPPDLRTTKLSNPHSYRGNYPDLALVANLEGEKMTIAELLALAESCVGIPLYGYKASVSICTSNSFVYIANEGRVGPKLASIMNDGSLGLDFYSR